MHTLMQLPTMRGADGVPYLWPWLAYGVWLDAAWPGQNGRGCTAPQSVGAIPTVT
jgi:hypothetical protein